ncbi:AraC family transcriptional regulator [Hydrogenovibrio kuenenii]|uniref:AraC family transcriptional regulator n=1 Tax=Hydrogenovibrio kuenenii TaxID=63658 RepID=UPI000467037A|nr:AraC family transcriptional regulator [Hydrogenovibrio kuenenii]
MKNTRYQQSIKNVCNYIYQHLDDTLSVEQLSEVAHFSKYHFHRLFSNSVGINVFQFIQLLRLKRASYQLVFNHNMRITDIAFSAGYDSHESFSRAFKKRFGLSPNAFRKEPVWSDWHQHYQFKPKRGLITMEAKVVNFPEMSIAVFEHRGPHQNLNESISQFINWRKETGHSPITNSRTFGLAYDDPSVTEPEAFRFDLCGEVKESIPENAHGVINKTIPGGRCVKIRHHGSHDDLDETVYYLYRDWLAENDETPRDFPCFFEYINFFPEVAEHELITDVYLPLA